ncbi:chemotaxis protein CheC [Halomarina oriensis]|uniref:Chemotaxis protein CheC n=1 Tax=Halomarina oriensis TaxID=671145 RepID=A0A6B0GLP0_9EURY|nr:chemotaxis protein CheC [Halomarina oriensis]MWG33045.1 chemotaxis protein CheC [Halomarina oriensis]
MMLDVEALGTFYEMAREGAELAAGRLTPMTDIQTRVGVTRLDFTTGPAIRAELDDDVRKVGIRVELTGGVEGTSLLLFDEDSAREVAATLTEGMDDGLTQSAVAEVSQIMNSGFVDGWADVLQTEIDVTTPEYVDGTSPDAFLDEEDITPADELALVFRSQIEAVGTEFAFKHYFMPERDSIESLFERRTAGYSLEYEKLVGFDRMAHRGAETVAENLTKMTGIDMDVDIRRINFVSLDAIPEDVPAEPQVSVAFGFDGLPSGYLLFLFSERSANQLVEATVGESANDDGLSAMGQDAVQELSNIMASGLLDGWANLLDTTIDHTTPTFAHDMGPAVVDPLIVGLSEGQEFAFVFDTRLKAVDTEFDLDIYAIPNETDLEAALERLDVTDVEAVPMQAEFSAATGGPNSDDLQEIGDIEGVDL